MSHYGNSDSTPVRIWTYLSDYLHFKTNPPFCVRNKKSRGAHIFIDRSFVDGKNYGRASHALALVTKCSAPEQHTTDISVDWWPMKICISWSGQQSETAPHEKGFLCSLCGLVWKRHTKSLLHNASYHCLELPCGSVPVSPLPQLFRPQSQRAPPFCLLWPGVNSQTMTRWANVHQVTPPVSPFPINLLEWSSRGLHS